MTVVAARAANRRRRRRMNAALWIIGTTAIGVICRSATRSRLPRTLESSALTPSPAIKARKVAAIRPMTAIPMRGGFVGDFGTGGGDTSVN